MHTWCVRVGSDPEVLLCEAPVWAVAVSHVADWVDARLGHVFCGEGLPEVFSRVPVGFPLYDSNGYLRNSASARLHDLFGAVLGLPDRYARELAHVAIAEDLAEHLAWGKEEN